MSKPQLEFVKNFLEENLKKGFIKASRAPCLSLILLAKKPGGGIRFINNILWKYLNKFCTAYLDNILIYSNSLREHKEHVRLVLAKLREFGI